MVSGGFFRSVLLAIVYVSYTEAFSHATHRRRIVGRGVEVVAFHPETKYETFGGGLEHSAARSAKSDLRSSATAFVASRLGVDASKLSYKSGYTAETAQYAYVKQAHNGIPISNAVANVAFKDNKVVALGSSFVDTSNIAGSTPSVDEKTAIAAAETILDGQYNNHPTSLEYVVQEDGSIALTYVIQVENDATDTWQQAYIDAHDASLVSVADFVAEAQYTVLPITKTNPTQGEETLTDPADLIASPSGWHSTGTANTTNTSGNNVFSFKGTSTNLTDGGPNLIFNFPYNLSAAPATVGNVHSSRVQGFYLVNTIHDVAYRYGFTEAAFNFQNNNFGRGGAGNDRVSMSVQDASGTNNANFATPPDGQSGRCRMYIFTLTNPQRDGVKQNDIPIHEVTHGISNRLTGGGTATCLQTTESGGMGEGWSDAFADWFQAKANFTDFATGTWVLNNTAGVRTMPYSVNRATNNLTYASLRTRTEVHAVGEIWANLLHNVLGALITEHGFSETAKTDPQGTQGNNVWLHLFIDGLALQPCNPTFLQARAAWIQADANRYGGANRCLLWRVFASRGFGVNAANRTDNADIPADC